VRLETVVDIWAGDVDFIRTQTLPQFLHNASAAVTTVHIGKCMHNIKPRILTTECICVLHIFLTISSYYFLKTAFTGWSL
jgi:hypothetical protein